MSSPFGFGFPFDSVVPWQAELVRVGAQVEFCINVGPAILGPDREHPWPRCTGVAISVCSVRSPGQGEQGECLNGAFFGQL